MGLLTRHLYRCHFSYRVVLWWPLAIIILISWWSEQSSKYPSTNQQCVCVCGFQSHLSRAVRCWGQPTTENSLSPDREESATVHAASVLPHHLSGTIYHDTCEAMTLVVNNSLAIRRHFCLHGHIRQRRLWERLFKRCFINGLTYLLPDTTSNSATHHSATVHIEAQWLGSAEACR